MNLKTKLDGVIAKDAVAGQLIGPWFDAWVMMLCLGGLANQLGVPRLAIGYWPSLLIVVVSVCLFIQPYGTTSRLKAIIKLLESK
jgi:hypothetical protein